MRVLLTCSLCFAFLATGCQREAGKPSSDDRYNRLLNQANDEKQAMPARLAAATASYAIARDIMDAAKQIKSLRSIGVLYWNIDSSSKAMDTFRELARIAGNTGDKESLGIALHNIGLLFSDISIYDSAIIYYQKADTVLSLQHDSFRVANGRINAGIAYKNTGAYEKAFTVTLDGVHMMENMNAESELSTAYSTLSGILKDLQRSREALFYNTKALDIRMALKDSAGIAASYNNMGNIYKSIRQYDSALHYYTSSLELKNKLGIQKSKATTIDNIADTYLGMGEYRTAVQYGLHALMLRNQFEDKDGWMTTANKLARIWLGLNEIKKAKALADSIAPLANAPIYLKQQLENALLFQSIYIKTKEYDRASSYGVQALQLKDSLLNYDMAATISKMNVRFKTEEQQKSLEISQKNEIIQEQQISKQQYSIAFMGGFILLLLFITYLLYRSNKFRKQSRERTELLMSELNHRVINNLQIISGMLSLQTSVTDSPKEIGIIEAAKNRIDSISIVHNLLHQKEYTGTIDMAVFIPEIAKNLRLAFHGRPTSETLFFIEKLLLNAQHAIPLGLITNELLTNIYKYAKTGDEPLAIQIHLGAHGDARSLTITDNGLGWDFNMHNRQNKGLGLLLVEMLSKQMKGSLQRFREKNNNICRVHFKI